MSFGATYLTSSFTGTTEANSGLFAELGYAHVETFPDSIDQTGGEQGFRGNVTATGYVAGDEQFSSFAGSLEGRVPFIFPQHFLRLFVTGAHSNNKIFSSNYYVGGGESNIAYSQSYLVRGYEAGSLFGRDIATVNLEYWLPLFEAFRGPGTFPVYYQRAKLKFFVDTGSAEYVADQIGSFKYWPVGTGVQLLQDLEFFYRVPATLALGFDYGLNGALGGESQFVIGVYGKFN